jgi:hypothetical protein
MKITVDVVSRTFFDLTGKFIDIPQQPLELRIHESYWALGLVTARYRAAMARFLNIKIRKYG